VDDCRCRRRTGWLIPSLVAFATIAFPSFTFAQRFDDVGVRAQGMAGAFVAVADDASATWWNPAGLATARNAVDFSGEVSEGGRGGVALGFPSLGLSYYRNKISKIQPFDSTAPVGSSRQDNGALGSSVPSGDVGLSQFGLTLGQSITRHLVVSTTVKLVNAQGDTRADLDIGAMAAFGVMRFGVTARDVRSPTFGSGADAIELERRARAGAAVIAQGRGALDSLAIAVDGDLNSAHVGGREEQEIAGGVETWWFGRRIGVRGGGGTNTAAGGGSFGAFGVTVVPYPGVNLDGAVTRGSDSARDQWSFGVRLAY
jgi:hypothetical protein